MKFILLLRFLRKNKKNCNFFRSMAARGYYGSGGGAGPRSESANVGGGGSVNSSGGSDGGNVGETPSIGGRWKIAQERYASQKKRKTEIAAIIQATNSEIARIEREYTERNEELIKQRNGMPLSPQIWADEMTTFLKKKKILTDKIDAAKRELETFPTVPDYIPEENRDLIGILHYMDFAVGDSVLDTRLKCSVKILSKHCGVFMGKVQSFYKVQLDGAVRIIPEECRLLTQGGISKLQDIYNARHIDLIIREEEADDNKRRAVWPEELLRIKREAYYKELEETEKIKKSQAEADLEKVRVMKTFPARFGHVKPGMTVSWTERITRCAHQSWEEYEETFSGIIQEINPLTFTLKINCSKTGRTGINKEILDVTFP